MPLFMMKPEEEWTEDEKKVAQDYDRKVKELQEEREKYRKVGVCSILSFHGSLVNYGHTFLGPKM